MEVTDATRLFARGVPITLQGKPVRLILDFEALEVLEEEFGGLDVFVASLREAGLKKNRVRNVRKAMTAGLLHTKPADQDLIDFELEVRKMLEFKDFVKYLDALTLALTEAMPEVKPDEAPKGRRRRASNGAVSIGSQQSISDEQTVSSNV